MSFICPAHGEFLSEALLKEHMVMDHHIPANAMSPSKEFQEVMKMASTKPIQPPQPPPSPRPPPEPPPPPPQKPIELVYQFTGNCPSCGQANLRTIMVNIRRSLMAVCYCENCRKDMYQMKVQPIRKEGEKHGNNGLQAGFKLSAKVRQVPSAYKTPVQHPA